MSVEAYNSDIFYADMFILRKNAYLCMLCLTKNNYENAKNENKCRCKETFYFHRHR